MNQEAYARGFVKAANAHGVDAVELAKYAQDHATPFTDTMMGAPNLVGAIAAAIKRRRTKEEQIDSDKKSVLKKYLVPGTAVYDYYKRIGRSQGEREEAKENNKKDNKKESK
jgi:hypothetical protein